MITTNFLLRLAIASLAILGVHHATADKNQLLGFLNQYYFYPTQDIDGKKVPRLWAKPLFSCIACMASVWGTLLYWGLLGGNNWREWVLFVLALSGLNALLRIAIDYAHTQTQIISGTVEQLNEAANSLDQKLQLANVDNADKSQQIDRYLETITDLRTQNENLALKLQQSTNVLT
jgi:hypothetical protein